MGWWVVGMCALGILTGIGLVSYVSYLSFTAGAISAMLIIVSAIGVILVAVCVYLLFGLRTVEQQERRVVQMFGRYIYTLRPGLQWILPRVMEIRATISVWEQAIQLFESPIKIDFRDGSATPKGTAVFVRLQSPDRRYLVPEGAAQPLMVPDEYGLTGVYRAIYEVDNWRRRTQELIQNALRSYLNGLTIDEALPTAKAGYDLATTVPDVGLPNHELERIRRVLSGWGFELMRITITDFDLEADLVVARGEVQKRERAAEAAQHTARLRALETMGTLIAMTAEFMGITPEQVRRQIVADPVLRERFQREAEDLVTRQVSIAGNALTDIRVGGAGGDIAQGLTALITAIKKA